MYTIIIFDQCGESQIKFTRVAGDKTHLNNVYINSESNFSDEVFELLYDEGGDFKTETYTKFEQIPYEPSIDKVIVCGFLP